MSGLVRFGDGQGPSLFPGVGKVANLQASIENGS